MNVKSLLCEFNLTQINAYATRQSNILDVVIESPCFLNYNVTQENPIAGSDHTSQRLVVELDALKMENNKQSTKINSLIQSLSNIDWSELFIGCKDTDVYAQRFHDILQAALSDARYTPVKRSHPNLPNYILKLTHVKRKLWKTAKLTGDTSQFKAASKLVRWSIRNYYKIKEEKLINQKDSKKFYAYLNSRIKKSKSTAIKLYDGNFIRC